MASFLASLVKRQKHKEMRENTYREGGRDERTNKVETVQQVEDVQSIEEDEKENWDIVYVLRENSKLDYRNRKERKIKTWWRKRAKRLY